MSTSVPSAEALLAATARYLEDELLPTLDGYHRFQTRVAVNALRIVERELCLGGAQRSSEQARLAALLGHDGGLEALGRELADGLRDGRVDIDTPGLLAHLRASLREALAVDSPSWIEIGPTPGA